MNNTNVVMCRLRISKFHSLPTDNSEVNSGGLGGLELEVGATGVEAPV